MDQSAFDIHPAPACRMSRRGFLKTGALALGGCMLPQALWAAWGRIPAAPERSLAFYNLHTAESLKTVYWLEGQYLPEALQAVNHILRDHRTGEVKSIDTGLLDLLFTLHQKTGSREKWHIISGYRSALSNEHLREKSSGIAKKSLHLKGMAADIRLPGVCLADLKAQAMALQAGGVGYYPASGFVHVDTGAVRSW